MRNPFNLPYKFVSVIVMGGEGAGDEPKKIDHIAVLTDRFRRVGICAKFSIHRSCGVSWVVDVL